MRNGGSFSTNFYFLTFRCPKPVNRKDNETECNEGTKVCQAGECKGSICLKFGMDQVGRGERLTYPVLEPLCWTVYV